MALIGKIRRNPWILIVMIVLGLGGFLIMDTMSSGNRGGGATQLTLGEVNGERVDRQEYENVYGLLYRNSQGNSYANRTQLWNWFVENQIVTQEAEAIGLGVSPSELSELEFGNNPSPIIIQRFSNPQTPGQVDRQQLNQIKTMIENDEIQQAIDQQQIAPTFVPYWNHQRREIRKDRLQSKLSNLVTKAMYTPTWMAEMGFSEQNQYINFAYVNIPFDEVANDEVVVSDDDLQAYLDENKVRYNRASETRKIEYLVFDVLPTPGDSAQLRKELNDLVTAWPSEESDSTFVLSNEGSISDAYFTKDNLSPVIADTVFTMNTGDIYGPYIDGTAYRALKVLDKRSIADSTDFRHILVLPNSFAEFAQANKTADSLINLLNTGQASFDSLAINFSQDPGSANNGGAYEAVVPGQMAQFGPEFNRVLQVTGNVGQVYKIKTNYGYHILEVQSRSTGTTERAQLAYLAKPIIPLKETQEAVYERAANFVAANRTMESLRAAVNQDPNLQLVNADPLLKNDYVISGLGFGNDTREMVCWTFNAEAGEVSPNVYVFTDAAAFYDNKYVIIGLADKIAEGVPSVNDIRDELEAEVIKEKKAEIIKGKISSTDLASIAGQFQSQVDTATNVTFSQVSINGIGREPAVLANALKLEQGQTSAPIKGNNGVYVLQSLLKPTLGAPNNIPAIRTNMSTADRGPVLRSLVPFMVEKIKVEDNRADFECTAY